MPEMFALLSLRREDERQRHTVRLVRLVKLVRGSVIRISFKFKLSHVVQVAPRDMVSHQGHLLRLVAQHTPGTKFGWLNVVLHVEHCRAGVEEGLQAVAFRVLVALEGE